MKKIYLWSLFLISISVLIFSCRKDYKSFFDPKADISSNLEAAKIFHAKGAYLNKTTYAELMAPATKDVLSNEKIAKKSVFYKLNPLWKDAFEVKAYDGSDLIVVPTPENRLSDKTFEIRRFFIFTKKGGSIVDGKIVEFLGLQYALKDKMDDIIANYKNSKILDLTGAIFEYDLNYFFLSGEKIVQGKRTGQFSKFNNLSKARTQSNLKTNYFETGPLDPNVCYELYFCTYENRDMTSATFIGYSDGCSGGTGGGSVSGYDSSSAYQSGGAPYAGNPPPADYAVTSDVTFSENEDQYTDADGSVNSSPERISYTYHYTVSRLQSTREVIRVMVYPATASPMVSYYIDSYNRDVTRSLTLLNQSNNYQINGTSVYINWYLSVNMRYTYTDGISPVFTRQRDKSQSTVEY